MNIKPEFFSNWRGDLLALVAGALIPFAFAPYGYSGLAVLGFILLMLSWLPVNAGRSFFRGWLFGVSMFGIGVSWVYISMNRYGNMVLELAIVVAAALALFLALYPATCGYLSKKLMKRQGRRLGFYLLVIVPLLWLLTEWLRSWLLTGFPWLSIGYSQIDSPLSGYAPLFGVFGISYAVVLTAALVLTVLLQPWQWRKIVPALVLLWLLPSMIKQVDFSEPVGEPFSVVVLQGNIDQNQKWQAAYRNQTLSLYADMSRANWGTDLIIWPETAIPAFYHQVKPYLHAIAQEARMNGSELIIGLPVLNEKTKEYYNGMMSLGMKETFYEKRHLVPFGEYLPLPDLLSWFIELYNIPMSDFSAGTSEVPVLEVLGYKAGMSICYEDVFGNEVAEALPAAHFLVNASNDAWFGESAAPFQHQEMARMRALENNRDIVRATNTGISAFINFKGEILTTGKQFEVDQIRGNITPRQGMTPFAVFGNWPIIVFASIAWVALMIRESYLKKQENDE